ncbi:MAG: sdaA, partial [Phenylobacterium sp.]|nr:sdaA [Phenylobacterium sp.]
MNVSVFDLFKLGIGPSSSHTMGPMTAAGRFLARLGERVERAARVEVTLYASLALTGRGHATDRAVILGLAGFEPRRLDPDEADRVVGDIRANQWLNLAGRHGIAFDEARDLLWEGRTRLPQHPNALKFAAFD